MSQDRECNQRLQSKRLTRKWAVGYFVQSRITRPIGCEYDNRNDDRNQGDAYDFGSDGIIDTGMLNDESLTDHEDSPGDGNPKGVMSNY
jgi:hypothetical protein